MRTVSVLYVDCAYLRERQSKRAVAMKRLRDRVIRGAPRRARNADRTARRRRQLVQLWRRDLGTCWLCHGPVRLGLPGEDPMSATRDHVIPKAHGGATQLWNLRLAHKHCNADRGTSAPPTLAEVMR